MIAEDAKLPGSSPAREPRQAIPIGGTFIGKKDDYLGMDVEVIVQRVVSPQDSMG